MFLPANQPATASARSISRKIELGQFFTVKTTWLTPPVAAFIQQALRHTHRSVLDPFAGDGDMLRVCENLGAQQLAGYDIDHPRWPVNDSLLKIDNPSGSLICTNPPYLARNSATRKQAAAAYFQASRHDDVYQIALDACLNAAAYVVAIVPETFILSSYSKARLKLVNVITENPFTDTTFPVCVACFDATPKAPSEIAVHVDHAYRGTLSTLLAALPQPRNHHAIRFNAPDGQLGLRAIDGTRADQRAGFYLPHDLGYGRDKIVHSSRMITYVEVPPLKPAELAHVLERANHYLNTLRSQTADLAFSPFKGNNKLGQRRRRIDYRTARYLLEKALDDVRGQPTLGL